MLWSQVDNAARQIMELMEPGDEAREEHKRMQLRELAALNGTLKVALPHLTIYRAHIAWLHACIVQSWLGMHLCGIMLVKSMCSVVLRHCSPC